MVIAPCTVWEVSGISQRGIQPLQPTKVDILSSTRSDAALAVQSIPAYVEASEFWLARWVGVGAKSWEGYYQKCDQQKKPGSPSPVKVHGIGYALRRDDVK